MMENNSMGTMKRNLLRSMLNPEYSEFLIQKKEAITLHSHQQSQPFVSVPSTPQLDIRRKSQMLRRVTFKQSLNPAPEPVQEPKREKIIEMDKLQSPIVNFEQTSTKYFKKHLEEDRQETQQRAQSHQIRRIKSRKTPMSQDQSEKLVIKQYWRQLMRWQGFDDYMYIRDPTSLKEIRGGEQISTSELFEPLTFSQGISYASATVNSFFGTQDQQQEYQEQQRKKQMSTLKQSFEPGSLKQQKFNPLNYHQQFIDMPSPTAPRRRNQSTISNSAKNIIFDSQQLLQQINEMVVFQEIETISPIGEKLLKMLWKIGVFNFFVLGCYIHCLLLEIYGRDNVGYQNWKRYIRICNIQGTLCHKYKLVAYKHLAKIALNLQMYDKSLIYLRKLLKLSWIVDDQNYELLSYDLISLVSQNLIQSIPQVITNKISQKLYFFMKNLLQGNQNQKVQNLHPIILQALESGMSEYRIIYFHQN